MLDRYVHRWEPAADPRIPFTLLLLHGTGGNEGDLLPLGHSVAPGAAQLSPRGNVLEAGHPRFFRRLAEGVLDEADRAYRANEMSDWVAAAAEHYGFDPARVAALGYSNGANLASAMLVLRPGTLAAAVLMRPMAAPPAPPALDLGGVPVLITAGLHDPWSQDAGVLAETLRSHGAEVELQTLAAGHELVRADLKRAREWFVTYALAHGTAT
jgi:phospholipase/carboxylesterase